MKDVEGLLQSSAYPSAVFPKGYDSGADVHRLIVYRPFDLISAFQKTMYIYSRAYVIGVDLARLL